MNEETILNCCMGTLTRIDGNAERFCIDCNFQHLQALEKAQKKEWKAEIIKIIKLLRETYPKRNIKFYTDHNDNLEIFHDVADCNLEIKKGTIPNLLNQYGFNEYDDRTIYMFQENKSPRMIPAFDIIYVKYSKYDWFKTITNQIKRAMGKWRTEQ